MVGEPVEATLVMLNIKLSPPNGSDNIAPSLPVMFAACDLSTSVDMILCGSVVSQLDELSIYCVPKTVDSVTVGYDESVLSVDAVTLRSGRVLDHPNVLDVHTPQTDGNFQNNESDWTLNDDKQPQAEVDKCGRNK